MKKILTYDNFYALFSNINITAYLKFISVCLFLTQIMRSKHLNDIKLCYNSILQVYFTIMGVYVCVYM